MVKFVVSLNHTTQKCWYYHYFAHNEEDVVQALAAMNINEVPDLN